METVFAMLGATNHLDEGKERQKDDYYATDPRAMELLLEKETFAPTIWEPACGEGHLSKVMQAHGYHVTSTDLVYRGFGEKEAYDFLNAPIREFDGDIVTNPPYKHALEFVKRALDCVKDGRKVAMFLRLQFLEGLERRKFFDENPPAVVYVCSKRLSCAINGDFSRANGAIAYAWFVWEKGFKGEPAIRWIG